MICYWYSYSTLILVSVFTSWLSRTWCRNVHPTNIGSTDVSPAEYSLKWPHSLLKARSPFLLKWLKLNKRNTHASILHDICLYWTLSQCQILLRHLLALRQRLYTGIWVTTSQNGWRFGTFKPEYLPVIRMHISFFMVLQFYFLSVCYKLWSFARPAC